MMPMTRENELLQYLHYHPGSSRREIESGMNLKESPATVKRILASLVESDYSWFPARAVPRATACHRIRSEICIFLHQN